MNPETKENSSVEVTEPAPIVMNYYIGCKRIQGRPMNLGVYNKYRGWDIPSDEDPAKEGFLVVYPDGYESWSPKEIFDTAYLPMGFSNIGVIDKNTINDQMVKDFIDKIEVLTIAPKTTVVSATLVNGFIVTFSSSCVDAANYDENLGKELCIKNIEQKVWELLGFLLQTAISGVK